MRCKINVNDQSMGPRMDTNSHVLAKTTPLILDVTKYFAIKLLNAFARS